MGLLFIVWISWLNWVCVVIVVIVRRMMIVRVKIVSEKMLILILFGSLNVVVLSFLSVSCCLFVDLVISRLFLMMMVSLKVISSEGRGEVIRVCWSRICCMVYLSFVIIGIIMISVRSGELNLEFMSMSVL